MNKKLIIGLLITVVAVTLIVSSVALAQETDPTLEALYEQIYELRRQIVERRVEIGDLSIEEGQQMLDQMDASFEERSDESSGRFFGMFGSGRGDNGWGRGYGHCWSY